MKLICLIILFISTNIASQINTFELYKNELKLSENPKYEEAARRLFEEVEKNNILCFPELISSINYSIENSTNQLNNFRLFFRSEHKRQFQVLKNEFNLDNNWQEFEFETKTIITDFFKKNEEILDYKEKNYAIETYTSIEPKFRNYCIFKYLKNDNTLEFNQLNDYDKLLFDELTDLEIKLLQKVADQKKLNTSEIYNNIEKNLDYYSKFYGLFKNDYLSNQKLTLPFFYLIKLKESNPINYNKNDYFNRFKLTLNNSYSLFNRSLISKEYEQEVTNHTIKTTTYYNTYYKFSLKQSFNIKAEYFFDLNTFISNNLTIFASYQKILVHSKTIESSKPFLITIESVPFRSNYSSPLYRNTENNEEFGLLSLGLKVNNLKSRLFETNIGLSFDQFSYKESKTSETLKEYFISTFYEIAYEFYKFP